MIKQSIQIPEISDHAAASFLSGFHTAFWKLACLDGSNTGFVWYSDVNWMNEPFEILAEQVPTAAAIHKTLILKHLMHIHQYGVSHFHPELYSLQWAGH